MDHHQLPLPRTTPGKTASREPSIVIDYSDDNNNVMRPEQEEEDYAAVRIPAAKSGQQQRRPDNSRSSTEPTPALLFQSWNGKGRESLERPSSSGGSKRYSRSHLRTRSSGPSALSAPLMTRAHSMPNPHMSRSFDSSTSLSPSPLRSPRARSPFKIEDHSYNPPPQRSPSWLDMGIEAIQEDTELDIPPRTYQYSTSSSASFSRSNSLRSSRRPSSPLHSAQSHPGTSAMEHSHPLSTRSASNSPSLNAQKYNEAYPTSLSLHHWASNSSFSSFSVPSTPTSARSRSPSISSLETIEDAPEQESQAEAEVIERLRLAVDSESDGESEGSRRRSLDVPRAGRRIGLGIGGERKRWSICGGEQRADLNLETIWED